jgi:hypothetical protein
MINDKKPNINHVNNFLFSWRVGKGCTSMRRLKRSITRNDLSLNQSNFCKIFLEKVYLLINLYL